VSGVEELREAAARWNPVRVGRRSARRFARRPRAMQVRTVAVVVATVAGLVIYVASSPEPPESPAPFGGLGGGSSAPAPGDGPTARLGGHPIRLVAAASALHEADAPKPGPPVGKASTSSRGVTAKTINVVFPVVNLAALSSQLGFAGDVEFTEQTKAIKLFVKEINDKGGINGRKINAIIANYNPLDAAGMRSLCKDWTEGSPAAFAVVDGVGGWTGDNQLCVTQEGETPLLAQWTSVTDYTKVGSPYLWWLGVDQSVLLATLVEWGRSAGLIGGANKLGIIVGDRASDQLALNSYLLPELRKAGISPEVQTIAASPSQSAQITASAPLVIQKLRSAGVKSIIPVIPFNVFFPLVQSMTQQEYFPKLLLSDYESSIESALGLIPVPYEKALDGQEGITTLTLGGIDDPRPESDGGYNPGLRSCWTTWHKAYPKKPKGASSAFIEEQGPVAGWCQAVRLFARAAKDAGKNLNRRTFVQAMSEITDFPGTWVNTLSYGKDKFYGPTQYQVVKIHNNDPPSSQCIVKSDGKPQGTCWVPVQAYRPLATG
jgi:Periplasmic binding protein